MELIQQTKCAVSHMLGCILALVEWKLVLSAFYCGSLSFSGSRYIFFTETLWDMWPEINLLGFNMHERNVERSRGGREEGWASLFFVSFCCRKYRILALFAIATVKVPLH